MNLPDSGFRWRHLPLLVFLAACLTGASALAKSPERTLGNVPLVFLPNAKASDAGFHVAGRDKTIWFHESAVRFQLRDFAGRPTQLCGLSFVDSDPTTPEGVGRLKGTVSHFRGACEEWQVGLPTYSRLIYRNLWGGIDLIYYGEGQYLKYDFVVSPGADPSRIRLDYLGADSVRVTDEGELQINIGGDSLVDAAPIAYQTIDGKRVEVSVRYRVSERAGGVYQVTFDLGDFDSRYPLVIDPALLVYCGFIGGSFGSCGADVAVDAEGCAYVVGTTISSEAEGFPVQVGPDLTFNGDCDAFIAKVNAEGTGLVYCGYIGGADTDRGFSVGVDKRGAAYVVGSTSSSVAEGFPAIVGPDLTYNSAATGNADGFVARVSPDGTGLEYCGYIGGRLTDLVRAVDVDELGHAFLAGDTRSDEVTFPVAVGPDLSFNGLSGRDDGFVAKVRVDGTGLVYCGYIGSQEDDRIDDIAVDDWGRVYVVGSTEGSESDGFPVVFGPDLTRNLGDDGFIAAVAADGIDLEYCGFVGGDDHDEISGVAVDKDTGEAVIAGHTLSTESSFPVTVGPDLTYNGGRDLFVAKLVGSGAGYRYCGYVGGNFVEHMNSVRHGVAVDPAGNAYIVGTTASTSATLPVRGGPDLTLNSSGGDAFVARIDPGGTDVTLCGYLGGDDGESPTGIAVDDVGSIYVTGDTRSSESTFPLVVGPDLTKNNFGKAGEAFVAKIPNEFAAEAACLLGTVSAGGGVDRADVLWINGSAGNGATRIVSVDTSTPIDVAMSSPPGGPAVAAFALYVWIREPSEGTVTPHPFGLGNMCLPSVLSGGSPVPRFIWNNVGFEDLLGVPDFVSKPAPSVVLSRQGGAGRPITATFQGIIRDEASAATAKASLTNAIVLKAEP